MLQYNKNCTTKFLWGGRRRYKYTTTNPSIQEIPTLSDCEDISIFTIFCHFLRLFQHFFGLFWNLLALLVLKQLCVTWHESHVMCDLWLFTYHMSLVINHLSPITNSNSQIFSNAGSPIIHSRLVPDPTRTSQRCNLK